MPFEAQNSPNVPQKESIKKKSVVIARVDIENQIRDIAEERLLVEKKDLSGFKGFLSRIWKHNLFHEYYRQKEIARARREIRELGNIYAGEQGEKEDHDDAMNAIVERFQAEYETQTLLRTGESKRIAQESSPDDVRLKGELSDLIKGFASGSVDEALFQKEKKVILEKYTQKSAKETLFADNLLEVAKQIKESIAHGEGLDALDDDWEIIIGNARMGVESEAQYSAVDKVAEKIQKSFVGRFVNEATVASAVAIAYGAIAKGATGAVQRAAKIASPLGMGLSAGIGGAIAGVRENKRLKEERAQHAREMAKGKEVEKGSIRRAEMEKYRYETKEASVLTKNLQESLEDLETSPSEAKLHVVLENLIEIGARINFAEREKIDLISFSDAKKVEQERTRMYVAAAQARVFLEKNIGKDWATFYTSKQGLDEYLRHSKEAKIRENFVKEKSLKDEAFAKMRRKNVAGAVLKGLGTGLAVGAAVQELQAYLGGETQGIFGASENNGQQASNYTGLGALKHHFFPDLPEQVGISQPQELVMSSKDFVRQHEDVFSKVQRVSWADNDTLRPDRNELGLRWGGSDGSGVDSRGNFVFSVNKMLPGGSFHGLKQWDPQQLIKEGKMRLLISLSRDTQDNVLEIPIDANGNAVIDPESPAGKLAFRNIGGHAKFLGKFAEVAVVGEEIDGVEKVNVLATHVGRGIAKVGMSVPLESAAVQADQGIIAPYIIPAGPRRPLEKLRKGERKEEVPVLTKAEKNVAAAEAEQPSGQSLEGSSAEAFAEMVKLDPEKLRESLTPSRAAAWHTLYKLENADDFGYADLNAATMEESDKIFNGLTRKLWNEFTTHRIMKYNEKTRKFEFMQESDHDGEACLKLLEIAGVVIDRSKVKFVDPGKSAVSGLIFDTSNKHGVHVQESGKRLVIDHHDAKSDSATSAAKFMYEMLAEMGLMEKTPQLDLFVEFITEIDNGIPGAFVNSEILRNYERNMYGLHKLLSVEQMLDLIEGGQNPAQPLPDDFLKNNTHTNPIDNKKQTLADYVKYNLSKKINSAEKNIAQMEKDGFVVDTGNERFGKILVDIKTLNGRGRWVPHVSSESGGAIRALSKGYGGYLLWSPEENSFKVFTAKIMDENTLPGGFAQGRNVRGHMWSKNGLDGERLTLTLEEVISRLMGSPFVADDKFKGALEAIARKNQENKDKKSKTPAAAASPSATVQSPTPPAASLVGQGAPASSQAPIASKGQTPSQSQIPQMPSADNGLGQGQQTQEVFVRELQQKYPEAFANIERQFDAQNVPQEARLNFLEVVAKANLNDDLAETLSFAEVEFNFRPQYKLTNNIDTIELTANNRIRVYFGVDDLTKDSVDSLARFLRIRLRSM